MSKNIPGQRNTQGSKWKNEILQHLHVLERDHKETHWRLQQLLSAAKKDKQQLELELNRKEADLEKRTTDKRH